MPKEETRDVVSQGNSDLPHDRVFVLVPNDSGGEGLVRGLQGGYCLLRDYRV